MHTGGVLQRQYLAETAAGTLTLEKRMAYEAAIKEAVQDERGYLFQLKRVLASPLTGNPDAFYFPTRHYGAFVISFFTIIFTSVQITSFFYGVKLTIEQSDSAATGAMFSMITQLQKQFVSVTGMDLPKVASNFLFVNADQLHLYIVGLAQAVYTASIVGQVFAFFFYLVAWVVNCLDMRAQILQARRGIWQFNYSKIMFKVAFAYVGTQISNGILTYILICFLVSIVTVFLAWNLTWDVIVWGLENHLTEILVVLIPTFVNLILNKLVYKTILAGPKVVRFRLLLMAWDMVQILLTVVTGVAKSITRFALVLVAVLFSLPRIDRSPFPAWLETYFLLDTGSKSYQALIVLYHHHNHPVMRVFVWLLSETAATRSEEVEAQGPLGSRWVLVGTERPLRGRELDARANKALADGLRSKGELFKHSNPVVAFKEGEYQEDYATRTVFKYNGEPLRYEAEPTASEGDEFIPIRTLRQDDFICVSDRYFRPVNSWEGHVSTKKRRVANTFWKAWMLHKNPELRAYSARGKVEATDAKAQKALKKNITEEKKKLITAAKDTVKARQASVVVAEASVVGEEASQLWRQFNVPESSVRSHSRRKGVDKAAGSAAPAAAPTAVDRV